MEQDLCQCCILTDEEQETLVTQVNTVRETK